MKTWIITYKDYQRIFNCSTCTAKKMIASDRKALNRNRVFLADILLIYGFELLDVLPDLIEKRRL